MAEHVWQKYHQIDFDNVSILAQERNDHKRCSLESWHIQKKDTLTGVQELYLQSTVSFFNLYFILFLFYIFIFSVRKPQISDETTNIRTYRPGDEELKVYIRRSLHLVNR